MCVWVWVQAEQLFQLNELQPSLAGATSASRRAGWASGRGGWARQVLNGVCVCRWQTRGAISTSTAPNDAIIAHKLATRYKPRYTHIVLTLAHTHTLTLACCIAVALAWAPKRHTWYACTYVCLCVCTSARIIVMQQLNAMRRENCTKKDSNWAWNCNVPSTNRFLSSLLLFPSICLPRPFWFASARRCVHTGTLHAVCFALQNRYFRSPCTPALSHQGCIALLRLMR